MKSKIQLLICIAISLACLEGFGQNLSNRGKDFWVGYGHHQFMETGQNNSQEMILYLSAEQTANVTVRIEGTSWVRNYNVPAGTVVASDLIPKGAPDARLISLPCSFVPPGFPCGGEGVFTNKGIHITSDVPIVAYAHIYGSASSGATMLMPVETWGYSYVTLNSKQNYAANCFSWAYVIAQHDNTLIEVTPTAITRSGKPANVPFTVTLNRGEIYQFMAGPEAGSNKPELSGSKIKSIANAAGECYPVAVFSGSSRTRGEPAACGAATGGDNDNQQCFPSQAWGKRYLTAPTSNSTTASTNMWNTFKIAVKDPTTQVRRNGTLLTGLIANSYYEFITNQPEYITSDKPVMVAQYIHSGTACFGGSGVGDPEMMYISPLEQGIKRIGFYRNNRESITANYLTLIIPNNGVPSLRIDGSATFDHTYPHPQLAGYTVVVKRWAASQAQAIAYSDSAFTAITYGLGSVESYGYNAGTLINNLSAFSHIHNTPDASAPQHPFTCTKTPIDLSVLMAYQPTRIDWLLSQLGSAITPNADVTINAPVSSGTVLINGVTYYKYTLPGTYTFNTADTFDIPIRGYHPSIEQCLNREDLVIQVVAKEKPNASFNFTHSGCTLDTARFVGSASAGNNYTVQNYNWIFPTPPVVTGQNIDTILAPGVYNVRLDVVTTDGCIDDTSRTITIYDKPPGLFMSTPSALCVGGSFTLNDTSSANIAVNSWYWDFGNGNTQTVTNGPTITYTYPLPGTYTIKHVASSSATCISDTIQKIVTVYAKPIASSFTNTPTGCLDISGAVQFNGAGTTPDGQAITGYSWNFGDPNANAGNPNTSTLQNPTHNFQQGTYNITFSLTTANGCTKDSVRAITFNLKPQLNYPALNAICENASAVSIATATVTNAVPGTGVYTGPGTDAAGMFNPAIAGPGTHTIWYHFTSSAGCIDSISRTIQVHAKPKPNFTFPNSGCLPANGTVAFTNTSTIADAQTLTWLWNFNDPNANAGNPNTSTTQNPSHNFLEGTYNINLQATSSNGCVKDTTITAIFSLTPALNFATLPAICENAAPVSVASASVTNGATGSGAYSGPGTNPAGQFDPAAAGPGLHTITYTFTTTGGCVQPITQTIRVHGRPRPNFSFSGNGCLPTNGQVQFNNTSTIPDAQTMTWLWNFNDPNANAGNPNTSTAQNPTHNYGEGTYAINLQATSSNGCVKDTTINAVFSLTPLLAYPALASVCESAAPASIATASATNAVTGTGVYSGPGTNAAGMFNPSAAGPGTHTITFTYTSTGGCTETITQNIQVHAKPKPNFTFTTGCLPANGLVQLTNTSTIADAQTMTWSWNFNDPNANAGNPNTSTAQNPTHNFGDGTYAINLQATSSNGCVKDTTINAVFSVTPSLSFAPLPGICQNPGAAPSSIAMASVTNGVNGTGVYSGPGTDGSGMFDPNTAGPGTHTITYTFTSAGGCTQSITRTVEVYPRPTAAFTVNNNASVCLGQSVTITDGSSISTGSVTNWNWNLGDGNTPSYTNGNPFTVTYTTASNFNVQLVAVSDRGCFSLPVTKTIGVHPVPVSNFSLPSGICMPGGAATFTNTSNVSDGSALSYQWNFGDGNNSSGTNPTHNYASTGTYNVTLIATSAFGCTHQSSQVLDDFYDKPIANFNVSAPELCQGEDSRFTDASTAPNSTIQSWSWSFGDNSTSTIANPTKRYNQPGVFDVKLTVKNAVGCESDVFTVPVTVHLQPVIDAGQSFVIPQGTSIQFTATANSQGLTFSWDPPFGLNDATALKPILIANQDQIYTLTATGDFGCTATDFISVKILKPVKVPNIFTPNGDNIHDRWMITNLADYPGCTVEVFNRYGQQVYYSAGYGTSWDGTYRGKAVPVGTYYYVIQLQNGFKPITGSVTIVR